MIITSIIRGPDLIIYGINDINKDILIKIILFMID